MRDRLPVVLVIAAMALILVSTQVERDWAVAAYLGSLLLLAIAGGCIRWLR